MQPCSREMQGGLNMSSLLNLQDLHSSHFDSISAAQSNHDFLDQMFASISPATCSWPDLNPTDLSPTAGTNGAAAFNSFDESNLLASKLRQHQISSNSVSGDPSAAAAAKLMMLQQQMMMARGFDPSQGEFQGGDDSVQTLFNGFGGSLHGGAPPPTPPYLPLPQGGNPSFGAQPQAAKSSAPAGSGSTTASGATAATAANGQPRQRVRARRGQATDPHSIAERLRRERIAERMKSLQELVPNANKTDKASMLDEIIDYVKFLQLQVKVLSMSRLGGASAVAPLVADMSSEGGGSGGSDGGGSNDSLTVTEHQVAKLMEEDMGSAMQYLQGKGLCLMPISLASAISTATCHSGRNSGPAAAAAIHRNSNRPTSPSVSVLTVQSAAIVNVGAAAKDAASVSKP